MAQTQLAGEVVLAEDIVVPGFILKGTTEAAPVSSTTPQNDDELFVTLPVGRWRVEFIGHASSASTTPDIAISWTFSGTLATSSRDGLGPAAGMTDPRAATTFRSSAQGIGTQATYGVDPAATTSIREDLFLDVSVAGVLNLQFSQGTSNATAVNLTSGSKLYVTSLSDA